MTEVTIKKIGAVRSVTNNILLWLSAMLSILVLMSPTTRSILQVVNSEINPIVSKVTAENIRYGDNGVYVDFRFYKHLDHFTPSLPFNGYYKDSRFGINKDNWPVGERTKPISRSVGWNYSPGWFLPNVTNICHLRIYTNHKYIPLVGMDGKMKAPEKPIIVQSYFWSAKNVNSFKDKEEWSKCSG